MHRSIIVFLSFFLVQISFAQEISTSAKENKTHATDQFEITYPSNWRLDLSHNMNTEFILFSELNNPVDIFRENISLIIQDMSENDLTMDDIVAMSEDQITMLITDAKVLNSVRMQKNGVEYHLFEYSGTQGTFKLHFLQHFYMIGDKSYVVTFSAETKAYEDFKAIGSEIMNSFVIK